MKIQWIMVVTFGLMTLAHLAFFLMGYGWSPLIFAVVYGYVTVDTLMWIRHVTKLRKEANT